MELTLKHVGFLGSLAHALVHLQQPSQGLALLRAAASVMRTNTPHPSHWFQGFPDPRPLHAHVLMDLVLPSMAYAFSYFFCHNSTVSEQEQHGNGIWHHTHSCSVFTAALWLLLGCDSNLLKFVPFKALLPGLLDRRIFCCTCRG